MGKKEAVPNRQYTGEFKQEVVRLAESIGGNAAAKRLGVPQSTVTNWVRRARAGMLQETPGEAAPVKRPVSELEAEIGRCAPTFMPLDATQLAMVCGEQPNSRDSCAGMRPAPTSSSICCRNSAGYGARVLGISDSSFQ